MVHEQGEAADDEMAGNLHLPSLEKLSVSCRFSLSVQIAIGIIRASYTTIKRLELAFDLENVFNRLENVISFPRLVTLSLCGTGNFSDSDLIAVLHKTPQLTHLQISLCNQLSDVSGIFLAKTLLYLDTLDASFCRFTNTTLLALSKYRALTLSALCISYCLVDSTGLMAVLQKCQNLRSLRTCASAIPWTTASASLPLLQNLTVLTLNVGEEGEDLDNILNIPFLCKNVEYIGFSARIGLYDIMDFSAYTVQNMPILHTINLSCLPCPCVGVCPSLDELHLQRPALIVLYNSMHKCFDFMNWPL